MIWLKVGMPPTVPADAARAGQGRCTRCQSTLTWHKSAHRVARSWSVGLSLLSRPGQARPVRTTCSMVRCVVPMVWSWSWSVLRDPIRRRDAGQPLCLGRPYPLRPSNPDRPAWAKLNHYSSCWVVNRAKPVHAVTVEPSQ